MGSAFEPRSARLAVATCAELPELDSEGRFLLSHLTAAGIAAEPAIWSDPEVDWDRFARVLLRTTWDYPAHHRAFRSWVRSRGAQLINPAEVVAWNLSKVYLEELHRWGFPVVPTRFTAPGERLELPADKEFVVKPAISAGSKDTARYDAESTGTARAHAESLLAAGRTVMVQPYIDSVDVDAETAVIVLGGVVSHAMRKSALLRLGQDLESGLFREEEMRPRVATPAQTELATDVVERVGREVGPPIYARVDMLSSPVGEPLILELELIEPSLFLDHNPPAAARLVELLKPVIGG